MCASRESGAPFPISLFMSQLLGRENKSGLQGTVGQKQTQAAGGKNTEKQTWRCWHQDPVGAPISGLPHKQADLTLPLAVTDTWKTMTGAIVLCFLHWLTGLAKNGPQGLCLLRQAFYCIAPPTCLLPTLLPHHFIFPRVSINEGTPEMSVLCKASRELCTHSRDVVVGFEWGRWR